jgi:DNA-damage-inducible protein D
MANIEKLAAYTAFRDALEAMKQIDGESTYWMARDVQRALGYTRWETFEELITRAKMACESAGVNPDNQFRLYLKMVEVGSGAKREVEDWFLSRYACYLIAMSGDPGKREVAFAKTYFAIQTRRQEMADALPDEERRLRLRNRVKDANRNLNKAAAEANVQRYAVFHDAGYKGLYGGIGKAEIKRQKGIPEKEEFLDCIDRVELAANEFRITQTEQKLRREEIDNEADAIATHGYVGQEVRSTIAKLGGTMPEKLPAAPPIKKVIAARKKAMRAAAKALPPARKSPDAD